MGKEKYQKILEVLLKKSPIVSFDSVERLVKNKKNVKQYAKHIVRNLIIKNKLKRLIPGFYSIHDDPSLAVFCFKPAYLGLQSSLSSYDLWEQETIPVIITSKKVRQGVRKVNSMNVLIRRIDKKYVFGIEYKKEGGFYFPYSDIEKTFIDMIYFRENISKEILAEIKRKIDKKKLNAYLKNYNQRFRKKVLKVIN